MILWRGNAEECEGYCSDRQSNPRRIRWCDTHTSAVAARIFDADRAATNGAKYEAWCRQRGQHFPARLDQLAVPAPVACIGVREWECMRFARLCTRATRLSGSSFSWTETPRGALQTVYIENILAVYFDQFTFSNLHFCLNLKCTRVIILPFYYICVSIYIKIKCV